MYVVRFPLPLFSTLKKHTQNHYYDQTGDDDCDDDEMTLIIIATTSVIFMHKNWKLDAVRSTTYNIWIGQFTCYTYMTRHYDCVHKFNYKSDNMDLSLVNSGIAHQSVN